MPNMNNIDPKKWIVTFGKSIGYATRDIVVDKLPNAADLLSEIGSAASEARDAVDKAVSGFKDESGSISMNSIKNSSQYKDAMKAIDTAVSDIKSGNLAHAMELTDEDSFGDDFGFDFDFDEETTTDEDGNTVATIAGITNDAKVNARATMRSARAVTLSINQLSNDFGKIQRSTAKGVAQSVVHATIVSTNLIHNDLTGINKRLDILNTNVASLVQLGQANVKANEQATIHYARMEEAYTMMMKMINESSGSGGSNKKESAIEDIVKYGFSAGSFKALVKENLVRLGVDSAKEMVENIFGILKASGAGFSDVFNIGMPIRSALEKILPRKTLASIENFDRKLPRQLNVLLSRIGDLSDRGGILGTIGQLFGINIKPEARIDLGKYNKGATAWSGTSKKALEEVIPHYLASIDEVLHRTLGGNTSYEARYFDYDRGVFRASSQIRKDFHARMQKKRNDNYYDSTTTLESAIKNDLGTYIVDDKTLTTLRNDITKLVNDAIRNDMRTEEFAKKLIKLLRNKKYGMNLSTASINEIVTSYISDMRKEKLMIAREMEPYMASTEGSALRQLAIGDQLTGYNTYRYKQNGKWVEKQSTDIYGMYDFNLQKIKKMNKETGKYATIDNLAENLGDLFYESSDTVKRRKELEERIRKDKEAKQKRKEEIDKIAKKLPKGDERYEYLMNLKRSIDQVSIVSPKMDAWLSSIIDGASLTIDDFVFGNVAGYDGFDFGLERVKGKAIYYASQAKNKVTKYAKESRKIVSVDDFVRIINNTKVRGRFLNSDMYDIHYIGDGENQRFDYAELYEEDRYPGFPAVIRASDVNLSTMKIKMRNVEKVPKPQKNAVPVNEVSDAESSTAEDVGSGWNRRRRFRNKLIGHGLVVGHAAKAAETNATKSKRASIYDRIRTSDFVMKQDRSIMENLQSAWRQIEYRLGGRDAVKATAKKAGIGAGIGGALGLLSQFGLHLGPVFMPGGPIGGAILGAGAGILASKIDFKKVLFGEKVVDEQGNVIGIHKTGLIGQWANTFQTALFDNVKSEVHSVGNEIKAYWNAKMVPELEYFFQERGLRFKSATDVLFKTITGIAKFAINPFKSLNNAANTLTRILLNTGVKVGGNLITTAAKLGIQAIRAPLYLGNRLGDLSDYGIRRVMLQGGINSLRGGLSRLGFIGTRLAHPVKTFKGENISYRDYRDKFGAFSHFGAKVDENGKVINEDLDNWIEDKLAEWGEKNAALRDTNPDKFRAMEEAERKRLYRRTISKRLNRQFRANDWNYRTSKIAGAEDLAKARADKRDSREFRKLVNKYNRKDKSQYRELSKFEAGLRYRSLARLISKQPEDIQKAFKMVDKNKPEDIENFILNPKAFVKMKQPELDALEKDKRSNNFMANMLHGVSSILNIMTGGKFKTDMSTDKEYNIPDYGNDIAAGDAVEKKEATIDEGPVDDTRYDRSMEQKMRDLWASTKERAAETKEGIKEKYASFREAWKNKKSPVAIFNKMREESYARKEALLDDAIRDGKDISDHQIDEWVRIKSRKHKDHELKVEAIREFSDIFTVSDLADLTNPDNIARRHNLVWDAKNKKYIKRSDSGHGRRIVGHGIGATLMNVGSKLIGGLKTAGSVAKTVGSKVWSGVKAGASVVSSFLGKNADGDTVDASGNIVSYDASGKPVNTSHTSQTKEATTKESNQSLSGSLKAGSARSGNFSNAALDNSYKQNMLSGMNAALFLLSKGAYNPGFSLGKTGGSGNLQMDNVAKKEAQYEVAVGSAVSNLTEKAAAARTTNGTDADTPLVEGVAKQAVIANDTGKKQTGLLETIASGITNLPSLLASALPAVLSGGTLAMIIKAVKSALGLGGAYDEALGNQDVDGNRTLYTDENGNIVDADDPNANKSIVYNHRLKEKILSKGTFDLAKTAAGALFKSKPVQAIINSKPVQGLANIGKKAATFITGKRFGVDPTDLDYSDLFSVDDAGNMIYNPSGPNIIQRFKSSKVGQAVSSIGNKIVNSSPVQKVVGGVKNLAGNAVSTGKSMFNTAKTAVTSKVANLADSAVNVGKQVASFASQKASALKEGAGTVIKNITGKADELATNALSKIGAKVSETTGRVSATDMWKNICSKFDDIINKLDNSKLKGIVGGAVEKVVAFLRKCMTKVKSVAPNILEKFSSKISSFADDIASKATKAIPIVGWAISAVTGVYDLVSGWFDAANLFYVNEEDVDGTMRTVSALVKFLFNSCPYVSMGATFITLICEFFEIDAAHWFANQLYNIIWGVTHGGDQSGNTLEQKQADFASEVDSYNAKNGTNVSVRAYSDQENQTLTQKIGNAAGNLWNKITGKNKNTNTQTTTAGHGSFTKSSPVGHGRRRAYIVGHGAIDQSGNVDNSNMKHQYTGLQDNGSTIQNGAYYFAQSDPQWNSETLAQFSPDTIGKSGCVMTSAAMGASTLLKQSINPSVFNSKYGNGNTSMNTRFGDLGLKVTRYPYANSTSSSHYSYTEVADVVTSALRQRKPVMLYGTKTKDSIYWDGGRQSKAHCVLATAMDENGNIIVNNPSSAGAQKEFGWKKTHPISSLGDVHWVQVMEKADGTGMSGILNTSGYTSSGNTAAGTSYSYSDPATTGGTNDSASNDPFTSAWSAIASGLSSLGGTLLSNLFKTNSGRNTNEEAPNAGGADTVGHGRNYRQDDPSVANLPTGQGWKMKDGGCGVATIANMISGHGSDLLKSSYAASMNHFVDGGLTGDGMAATLSDMGYDPQSVTDTNTLNSLLARGVHVAALGAGHGSSAFPKNSPHWVDLQGYDPFTGKYTWMDPEKGLRTGNLDPSEISSAITIGHGAVGADGNESNTHMNVHSMAKKITAKIYTPTNLTASEFNDTIDKTARSYSRDPNGFLWNKKGSALVDAEKKYGINGLSLLGIAQTESGLNSSSKAIQKNNATSIMGSNGLKTYGSPEENIDGTGQLLGVKYKDWFGSTGTYDIAPHYCPDIPSIGQYSSKWADNVTNYTTRFAAIAKGGDGSNTENIETDKGIQSAGAFSITDSGDIPSATMSSSYSSSQSSSDSSDPFSSGWSSISSGLSSLGGTLLSNLFKNSGHGRRIVGHGGAKTGGVSASMLGTGGFVDDSIMGYTSDDSLVTGNTNSGVTSRNNNTKIVGKMDIIISILRAMLKNSQASLNAQAGHGSNAARTSSSNNRNFTVGHGSNSNDSLVRYRPTKTMRDRSIINRYGSTLNISNPNDRIDTDADYLRQVHTSISTGARKNLN